MSAIDERTPPNGDAAGGGDTRAQPQVCRRRCGGASRALLAAVLSLLMPGAGQLYLGWIQRGVLMLGTSLAVIGVSVGLWLQGTFFLLGLLVRPPVLLGLLVGNAALLAFRLFAVIDAYRLGQIEWQRAPIWSQRWRRFGTVAILTVLLILTAAPHAAAGYYNILTYDLLTDIFPSDPAPDTTDAPVFHGTPPPVPTIPADL